jgi:hypothetical protein
MSKLHVIDLERLDVVSIAGDCIKIHGAMSVRESSEPPEDLPKSNLSLPLDQAAKLYTMLGQALSEARAKGWAPRG